MEFYHASFSKVQRSKGQNAIASAAYCGGICLQKLSGEMADYRKKKNVCGHKIILPSHFSSLDIPSSQWVWTEAEKAEHRKNSTTARRGDLALPREFTQYECFAVGYAFTQDLVDRYGVIAQVDFHHLGTKNPHIDLQWTTRIFDGEKFIKKTRELDDKTTGPQEILWLREQWAIRVNEVLTKYGKSIDHRSYKDQGSEKLPTRHLGRKAAALEKKGIKTEIGKYNGKVREYNAYVEERNNLAAEIVFLENELTEVQNESTNSVTSLSQGDNSMARAKDTNFHDGKRNKHNADKSSLVGYPITGGHKVQSVNELGGDNSNALGNEAANRQLEPSKQRYSRITPEVATDTTQVCGAQSKTGARHQWANKQYKPCDQRCVQPVGQPNGGQNQTQSGECELGHANLEYAWGKNRQDRGFPREKLKLIESIVEGFDKMQPTTFAKYKPNSIEGIKRIVQQLANARTLKILESKCVALLWDNLFHTNIQRPNLEHNLITKIKAKVGQITGQVTMHHIEQAYMLNAWDNMLSSPSITPPPLQVELADKIPELTVKIAEKTALAQVDTLLMEQSWNAMLTSPPISHEDITSTSGIKCKINELSTRVTLNKISEILAYQSQWMPTNNLLRNNADIRQQLTELRTGKRAVKRQVEKIAGIIVTEHISQKLINTSNDDEIGENNGHEYYDSFKPR